MGSLDDFDFGGNLFDDVCESCGAARAPGDERCEGCAVCMTCGDDFPCSCDTCELCFRPVDNCVCEGDDE